MADMVASSLKTYLISVTTATNVVGSDLYDELGVGFTFGTNLYMGIESELTNCITIIPYPAGPPIPDGSRQSSGIQIRAKMDSYRKSARVSQSLINMLHNNTSSCTGRISAVQSTPITLGIVEGGEGIITVSNFIITHVKI